MMFKEAVAILFADLQRRNETPDTHDFYRAFSR
jgi:hypothetical protein